MSEVCPNCDFSGSVSYHWRYEPDHRPSITNEQHEVITGVLMGDGSINTDPANPRFVCVSTTKEYLEYLDSVFGILSNGIRLRQTAEDAAEMDRESGFNEGAKEENYSDKYALHTKCHPELDEYTQWYSSGEKVFPDQMILTPRILKHWFVCDGTFDNTNYRRRIRISLENERRSKQKIEGMFAHSGLPTPNSWNEKHDDCSAVWSVDHSAELFEFMGDPIPGFEYKWPSDEFASFAN